MYRYWNLVTRPLLDACEATEIIEIGSDRGYSTELLLEWAKTTGGVVHVIDPDPKYDVGEWQSRWGDAYVPHVAPSLDVLADLPPPDAVLIDGDHNWYTVVNELRSMDRAGEPFPLILLHDVGWPYGRRDLYYEPSRIPEEFLHEYWMGSIAPGQLELGGESGFNAHLNNAMTEGSERSGVLTGVEDFVEESSRLLELHVLPGIHGLAILVEDPAATPEVRGVLESMRLTDFAEALARTIESDRIEALVRLAETRQDLDQTRQDLVRTREKLQAENDGHARRIVHLTEQLKDSQEIARRRLADVGRERSGREKVESELEATTRAYERMRSRRSVRFALLIARAGRPIFRALRWWRTGSGVGASTSQSGAATSRIRGSASSRRETSVRTTTETPRALKPERADFAGHTGADVIVCVHNAPEDVARCLESLQRNTNLVRHHVTIVDDGSDQRTARLVDEWAATLGASLVRNEEARGYTRAANQGLRASSGRYAVLLNSDTIVTSGWLERLIACADHDEDIAIVGPLSNAASWQSIPQRFDEDGSWAVNPVSSYEEIEVQAARLASQSSRVFPEVTLVNGFCFLITRRALTDVGFLDEETFPKGYGEEDDLSIRCAEAGLRSFIADDCYVYHAKSRSFTPDGRRSIVEISKGKLAEKHGRDNVRACVSRMETSEFLAAARKRASLIITARETGDGEVDHGLERRQLRIAWISPHLEAVGGVRRKIEMTNRLVAWGAEVDLVTPDGVRTDWLPIRADVVSVDRASRKQYDVGIVSDPDVVLPFQRLEAERSIVFHLAPYALYRAESPGLEAFYNHTGTMTHIANSTWTADQVVAANPQLRVEAVVPGAVDHRLFHPSEGERRFDVSCFGSDRELKGTKIIEQAARGLEVVSLSKLNLPQHALARAIGSSKVFMSGCRHEGFNLPALEAMACGIPVVMTDDGGSREYAVDGHNATVVPVDDVDALRDGVLELLGDAELRVQRIEAGLETAWRFDWDSATRALLEVLGERRTATPESDR